MTRSRAALGSMTCPLAVMGEARQTLARLEQVTRPIDGVTDPAQAYHLMGAAGQLASSLEHSIDHLGQWWSAQARTHSLDATHGPFADDPAAAAATIIASLTTAAAACADLAAALERAQLCSADLTPARSGRTSPGGSRL